MDATEKQPKGGNGDTEALGDARVSRSGRRKEVTRDTRVRRALAG
jgi:hypothetical protein